MVVMTSSWVMARQRSRPKRSLRRKRLSPMTSQRPDSDRELFVAAQFAAGDGGHDLFVGHGEAEVATEAILEAEEVVAHDIPAAGFRSGVVCSCAVRRGRWWS